jgi:cyclic pyranopterin phosphate synthase
MSDDGFCAACNRARLTARGGLRACLADDSEVSMLQALRSGASRDALMALIAKPSIWQAPQRTAWRIA